MMTPPSKRQPASPEEWLLHAVSDLNLANLGLHGEVLPEQICFHAQQAAEKALKAVLIHRNVDFPFTHDLEELLDTLDETDIALPTERVFASGKVADTVDYAVLVGRIRAELAERRFGLVEELAAFVAALVLDEFHAPWVRVSVAKLGILKDVRLVGVTIERGKQ